MKNQPVDTEARQTGRAVTAEQLQAMSLTDVVRPVLSLIRTDFGGSRDPVAVVQNKMKAAGFQVDRDGATVIMNLMVEVAAGCRRRIEARISEIARRASEAEQTPRLRVIKRAA